MPFRQPSATANKGAPADTSHSRLSTATRRQEEEDDINDLAQLRKPATGYPSFTMNATSIYEQPQGIASKLSIPSRRRQSTGLGLRVPSGPRPLDLQKRVVSGSSHMYGSARDPTAAISQDVTPEDLQARDISQFSFASIDPTRTVPQDAPRTGALNFDAFSEPNFDFDAFHENIVPSPRFDKFSADPMRFDIPGLSVAPKTETKKVPMPQAIPIPSRKVSGNGSVIRKASTASITSRPGGSRSELPQPASSTTSILRGRRQTQFPPSAFNNIPAPTIAKPPRKSIGPGTFVAPDSLEDLEFRQSANTVTTKLSPDEFLANMSSTANFGLGDTSMRNTSNSPKPLKIKSGLAPYRHSSKDLLTPSKTPEGLRINTIASQTTPNRRSGTPGRTTTPGTHGRRQSMATGLGARTISPTDARRLKRMSAVPPAPPLPQTRISQAPATPQPDMLPPSIPRSNAQSPATAHRKSMTPSSSRTTPDPNRKSYSSGQSLSSSTSYSSARNSAAIAAKLMQSISTSRLPTPKPRTEAATTPPTEEEIPPVPAIPKSYESPASELEQPYFSARSSSLQRIDTPASESPLTNSAGEEFAAMNIPYESFAASFLPNPPVEIEEQPPVTINAFDLLEQSLRLPPINLQPLSTPTMDKINSLELTMNSRPETPPNMRHLAKTPSTPMTASKATFFPKTSRGRDGGPNAIPRSNTSHFVIRSDIDGKGPSPILPTFAFESDMASHRSVSPYLSTSAPKDSGEFPSYMRPNFSTELHRISTQARPNGPRAPSYSVSARIDEGTPVSDQTTEGSATNSIVSIIPTLTRKPSDLKLVTTASPFESISKYSSMPPPKLPASATWANLGNKPASPTQQKSGFFRSRRKASTSSSVTLSDLAHQTSSDSTTSKMPHPTAGRPSMESIRSFMMQPNRSASLISTSSLVSGKPGAQRAPEPELDRDDLTAEEEMKKLASKRRDFESAARELDALRARARPALCSSASAALQHADLNIFERGEVLDFADVYFTGTKSSKKIIGDLASASSNFGYDDDRGDYNIVQGDHLAYRYEVVDLLGKGSFGQVVRCIDHKTGILVAIKIIRNKKRFHQQALVEVDILKKLKEWDPEKKYHVVDFDQSFYFRGHLCISTDLLSMNLYEFIKAHDFRGFSLKLIRRFTKQMLDSLVLLHGKKVIHCDLKPENILLAHPAHSEIKVIDFGSSCFENEKVYTYIQSRFYRSPEVILGMSYGMPIDMWSLGCILAELFTGYPIFPGENEQEQLACIMEIFGPPEKHLIEKSSRKKLFFDSMGKPRLIVSSKGRRRRPSSKDLRQVLKCDDEAFLDFISRCLRWDPARRMNPHEANRHEFITGIKMAAPAAPVSTRKHITSALSTPLKRGNSISTAGGIRPLPQPPSNSLKPPGPGRQDSLAVSPNKIIPRRQSNFTAAQVVPPSKRASHALTSTVAASTVGRITSGQRGTNSKPDLAKAAAAASLVR